jgi:hypothetical protein
MNTVATAFTLTTGSVVSGDIDSTKTRDRVSLQITDDGTDIDCYFDFDVGGSGSPSIVTFNGRINGANDNLIVYAYNWSDTAWDVIGFVDGKTGVANVELTYNPDERHVGAGANLGKVRIRFANDPAFPLTSSNFYVEYLLLTYDATQQILGYVSEAAVWIDTEGGQPGTKRHTNGTIGNPVDNLADALTIANDLGITFFKIVNKSSITLTSDIPSLTFRGVHWDLDLNGKNINHAHIEGAHITGTGVATIEPHFEGCYFSTCSLPPIHAHFCSFSGTMTLNASGDYVFDHGYSEIEGSDAPIFEFSNNANIGVNFRHTSSGLRFKKMGIQSGHIMSVEGFGQVICDSDCVGGNAEVRGTFKVTNNGSIVIDETANLNKPNVNDEVTNVFNAPTPEPVVISSPYDRLNKIQKYILIHNQLVAIGPV